MTDKQPEALLIADHLEISATHAAAVREKAAAELRRLHEENVVLKRCLFQMQEAAKGQGLTAAKAQGDNK